MRHLRDIVADAIDAARGSVRKATRSTPTREERAEDLRRRREANEQIVAEEERRKKLQREQKRREDERKAYEARQAPLRQAQEAAAMAPHLQTATELLEGL